MVGGGQGIFYKGDGKKMALHRTYEKILKYKLKAYKKKILDFICGSPTSTKCQAKMKRQK